MMANLALLLVGAGFLLGTLGYARMKSTRNAALVELLDNELEEATRSPQDISNLMERAGNFTERAIGKTESAGKLRFKLIQSGSTMKVGEFWTTVAIIAAMVGAAALLLTGSPVAAIALTVATPVVALSRLKTKARKRVQKMESQLPEVLQLIAGALDSGTSLLVAMELAGEEGEAPLAPELGRVVTESGVGRPLLEALEAMAERIGSRDISWTVKAIRIQHQTGGKLADTLRTLAEFMGQRQEVRGEIRALSAEAKISGKVLIAMPITIGVFFYMTRREYVEPLFTTTLGKIMLGMTAMGMVIGHLWMKKLANVEM